MINITKLKNKNYIIISIGAEKGFDKIQHLFMILEKQNKKTTLQKVGIENIPQHNKDHI